jgi:Membrane protein involved in the export of O-antigen and teichoic acid
LRPFDTNGEFAGSVPQGGASLRRLAVRGAGMTVLSSGVSLAIQMAATVVLARILTPKDFGLVAMVTTFSLLFSNFGINGVTEAIVQQERFDNILASNLFWMTLGGGVILTGGFAAAGSLLAKFYAEPLVATVTRGISLSILFTSVSVVHLALLKRAMRFSALAKNDMIAKAVSVATSIALGCAGWGYWALVAGVCALQLSATIGAFLLCRWIPSPPRHAAATLPMTRFATYTYGRFSVNYFARNVDNLLVGWRFGAPALGFYKKAYDLFSLSATQLVSSISVVAVAALSRARDNHALFIQYLLGAMSIMTFLGMWIAGDLTLIGNDIIYVLLGPGWGEAGRIFTWFAPGIGAMMLYGTHGWIHLSIGRADRWLRWGIIEWSVTILLFLAAIHWGPRGIAVAWCLSFWILTLPAMSFAGAPIGLGIRPVISAVWRYVAAAAVAGPISYILMRSLAVMLVADGVPAALLRIAVVSLMYSLLYLGAIVVLHRGPAPIVRMVNLVRDMVSVRREEKAPA